MGALGFPEHQEIRMTNKIKEVELVWTLGAMLAKSASLTGGGASSTSMLMIALLFALLAGFGAKTCVGGQRGGYRGMQQGGHESD